MGRADAVSHFVWARLLSCANEVTSAGSWRSYIPRTERHAIQRVPQRGLWKDTTLILALGGCTSRLGSKTSRRCAPGWSLEGAERITPRLNATGWASSQEGLCS